MENKNSNFDLLSKKITEICFLCKDIFLERNSIKLETVRKNMITKVFTPKQGNREDFVFLSATSYFDSKRMVEVVASCLMSANKKVESSFNLSNEFVEKLSLYISEKDCFNVKLLENSIVIESNGFEFQIFEITDLDTPSKESLTRSVCLLLAFCGKIVRNNLDSFVVNDYGITSLEEAKA